MNHSDATDTQAPANGKMLFADRAARALLAGRQDELFAPGDGWRQVKHNASRTVFRGEISGRDVYLKQFHPHSALRRAMRKAGRSDARREFLNCRQLAAAGVATTPALSACCNGRGEWLLTEAVEPSEPADRWHVRQLAAGSEGERAIRGAIDQLAELVGRMHAAGVFHDDLHCGNVLVQPTGGGAFRLVLMDLHRARRCRRLSRRLRTANLAQLMHDRYELTTRTQRLRFLKRYLAASGAGGSLRGWEYLVDRSARRHRRRQYAQRDRRIFRRNRYLTPIRLSGGWRGHVVLASKRRCAGSAAAGCTFTAEQWRAALADPDALADPARAEVCRDSSSYLLLRREIHVGGRALDVHIHRPRCRSPRKYLLDCLRRPRVRRTFRLGHMLLTRHIPTALPLAVLEKRRPLARTDSLLITEAAAGEKLDQFLCRWLAEKPRAESRLSPKDRRRLERDLLRQLGRLLRRLHDHGFAHRNLKASSLLVQWTVGEKPELLLADLDGLKRPLLLTQKHRLQGLMRLNVSLLRCGPVSRSGRLRMLLGYLRRPGAGRIRFKPYWRMLEDWSARKLRRMLESRGRRRAARRPTP